MEKDNMRKRLREYLKGFRDCQNQAKEIEKMLVGGGVPEMLREPLRKTKKEFELQCQNVQLIIGYSREGLERRILNAVYLFGKSMAQIAKETGYSYGYCANVELGAIKRLCELENVALLLSGR